MSIFTKPAVSVIHPPVTGDTTAHCWKWWEENGAITDSKGPGPVTFRSSHRPGRSWARLNMVLIFLLLCGLAFVAAARL